MTPDPIGGTPTPTPPAASDPYTSAKQAAENAFQANLQNKLQEADQWLARNAESSGVQVRASGLQYRVVKTGNSNAATATQTSSAKLHFDASSIDGRIFNSSFQRGAPVELQAENMIAGWREAVDLMNPGDEWIIYLPPALAYGEDGYGASVPPNAVTVYRIALIDKF
ncbi:MAG: FKBP-type peptidyl-prolyl cis-trans isomerase [Pseudomonadota bacterium]